MSRFTPSTTSLSGLMVIERQRLTDHRGFLARLFCAEELASFGWKKNVSQINHTLTVKRGTVRGMHFQHPPHCEMKLVSCLQGEVWDVAVDIRAGSPTFLNWYGVQLSAGNCLALMIPEGFAHGYQTLTDNVELLYFHSAPHVPGAEGGLSPLDEDLDIGWPLPVTEISERDRSHPKLTPRFQGIRP